MTELILDPTLPAKTWEVRTLTNRVISRGRFTLDADLLLAALEDPKVERLAVGEEAHVDLRRLMGQPGLKTSSQRAAEESAGLRRGPQSTGRVDRSTFGGFEPKPPGTSGPGGTAS